MKTERERKETIDAINVLLNCTYDSTLDEILALLQKIEDDEDEEDIEDVRKAREDIKINGTVAWEDIKNEMKNERKKDVA
ncbi:MAG: hypothetical protein HC908_12575 [Calothrix sp. SM1_7_51]|nr:hypothetical protein [Calothrix sp. SM1_7_51]